MRKKSCEILPLLHGSHVKKANFQGPFPLKLGLMIAHHMSRLAKKKDSFIFFVQLKGQLVAAVAKGGSFASLMNKILMYLLIKSLPVYPHL